MNQIIAKNLELMISNNPGGMKDLLGQESLGGNAGCEGNRPCAATHFYYDQNTGEIIQFGNCQDVPEEIKKKYMEGIFRLSLDTFRTWKFRITYAHFNIYAQPLKVATRTAKKTLVESIKEYNRLYAFEK